MWNVLPLLALACSVKSTGEPNIDPQSVADPAIVCPADAQLLTRKYGETVRVETPWLIQRATHCEPPRIPALARQARIEGTVAVNVLVDKDGRVGCVGLIHGHPLLAGPAMNAASKWTFRPYKHRGMATAFRGVLLFHYSTSTEPTAATACTVARW